jgi:hypothetical protein
MHETAMDQGKADVTLEFLADVCNEAGGEFFFMIANSSLALVGENGITLDLWVDDIVDAPDPRAVVMEMLSKLGADDGA